jgi:hypothetical protein
MRDVRYFEDLKEGDIVWIGWSDEELGLFGNVRQIPVLKISYSNSSEDDRMFLRFAPDDIYDIELMDTAVYPHSDFGFATDTTPLIEGKEHICSWISTSREKVADAVRQDALDFIQQKIDDIENIRKKIDRAEKAIAEL